MVGDPVYGDYGIDEPTQEKIDPGFQSRFKATDDGRWMGPGEASGVAGITPFDPERIADTTSKVGLAQRGKIDRRDVPPDYSGVTGVEPPSEIYRDPIMDMVESEPTPAVPRGGGADVMDAPSAPVTTAKGPPSIISRPAPSRPPQGGPHGGYQAPSAPAAPTAKGPPSSLSPAPSRPAPTGRPGSGGGGGGGGNGCFLKGTQVTMADGSTKAVEKVDLGDEVAKGGKVFAAGRFLIDNLHNYKGIKVSGSHMVNEDGNWTRVEDSKHGKALEDDEHTVYVFGSENRRILINDILFTDYFEVKEQEKFLENEEDFFKNWKQFSKEHNESNVNILNAS